MKNHCKKEITLGDSGVRGLSIYGSRWLNEETGKQPLVFCVSQGAFDFQLSMTPDVMRQMGATLIDMAHAHDRMCAEETAAAVLADMEAA